MSENSTDSQEKQTDYVNFYDLNKNRIFLEPALALEQFNQRLQQRYKAEEAKIAEQFQVLEARDLQKLTMNNSAELRLIDTNLIHSLNNYISKNRADLDEFDQEEDATTKLLETIGEYIEESYNRDCQQGKKLKPNSLKSRIRRTAILMYKTARIPRQQRAEGSFKQVYGPLGIDHTSKQIERFDAVINSIHVPLWQWDGNLHDIQLPEDNETLPDGKNKEQWVRMWEKNTPVQTGPHILLGEQPVKLKYHDGQTSIEETEETPSSLEREAIFIDLIRHELAHPSYLPAVYHTGHRTGNAQYMEYIPGSYHHEKPIDAASSLAKVGEILRELWLEHGILNHDIKPENIRLRQDGSPVIIDWGFFSWIEPGAQTITLSEISGFSPPFVNPDLIMAANYGSNKKGIDIDKRLTYQLACVGITDIFSYQAICQTLLDQKAGFKWPGLKKNGESIDQYSVTDDTFYGCWKQQSELKLPQSLVNMLTYGLQPRAIDRPQLNAMIQALETTQNSPLISYQECIQRRNSTPLEIEIKNISIANYLPLPK